MDSSVYRRSAPLLAHFLPHQYLEIANASTVGAEPSTNRQDLPFDALALVSQHASRMSASENQFSLDPAASTKGRHVAKQFTILLLLALFKATSMSATGTNQDYWAVEDSKERAKVPVYQ